MCWPELGLHSNGLNSVGRDTQLETYTLLTCRGSAAAILIWDVDGCRAENDEPKSRLATRAAIDMCGVGFQLEWSKSTPEAAGPPFRR